MVEVPRPDEIEPDEPLGLEVLVELLRGWRNHWAEVERIFRDFPDEVKQVALLRPADPDAALAEARAQFAVLFHPDAIAGFVGYLGTALVTIENLLDGEPTVPASPRGSGGLRSRVEALEQAVAELKHGRPSAD